MFILKYLVQFLSGIAFILVAFSVFRLGFSDDISALLTIGFSDLYFGRFAK